MRAETVSGRIFSEKGYYVVNLNSRSGAGVKQVTDDCDGGRENRARPEKRESKTVRCVQWS